MMTRVVKGIDALSRWAGQGISWLLLVLVFIVFYDVIMRYMFSAPTKWAFDISYMLGGSVIVVVSAWVLARGEHIAMDLFYCKFSPRTKLIIDVCFLLIVFFPLVYGLLQMSLQVTWTSIVRGETSGMSFWKPPFWPFRTAISCGLALLLVQGVALFIRKVYLLSGRQL